MGSIRKIIDDDYHCFGCAKSNDFGLRLVFTQEDNEVVTTIQPHRKYESYPGILHGGIIATILDECMGKAIEAFTGQMAVTVGLRVKYCGICESGQTYRATGRIDSNDGEIIEAEAKLISLDGGILAIATATWLVINPAAALEGKPALPPRTKNYIKNVLTERELEK